MTGGSGFIGRWVTRALASFNADVHILDMQSPAGLETVRHTYHHLDLRDQAAATLLLTNQRIQILVHLGGQADVAVCQQDPIAAYEKNVACTYTLLEACRIYGKLESVVAVSSNHIYGDQEHLPTIEDAPLNGSNVYATSKLCADVIARAYGKTLGLPVSIARITNTFGGDDPHVNHIITGSIISSLKGEVPVINRSGRDSKGYLYVKDTVNGLLTLAEQTALRPELHGEAFNFSPDSPICTKDLVQAIHSVTGSNSEIVIRQPLAPYEIEDLANSKACDMLGWTVRYSLLEALAETVSSFTEP